MSSLPGTGCPSAGFYPMQRPRLTDANWGGIGADLSASVLQHPFLETYINNSRWEDTNEATPSCNEWAKAPAK